MSRTPSIRRLRRLRGVLGALAAAAALCVMAATRMESTGRALAAIGAVGCVIAWLVLLDIEGRLADSVERRGLRRGAASRRLHHAAGRAHQRASRRRAA